MTAWEQRDATLNIVWLSKEAIDANGAVVVDEVHKQLVKISCGLERHLGRRGKT